VVYRATEKTGEVVAALSVSSKDDLVCITSQGNTLKLRLADIAVLGKTAMGVRIVNITRPDLVVGVARVMKEDEDGVREAEEAARAAEARGEGGAEGEDVDGPLPDEDDDGEENRAGPDEVEGDE
jgi:DNA gyrase subunit A